MIEPKLSNDGNCPACFGGDWKLAKVLVLNGVSHINTESDGGGFGVGFGRGGVSVNYQNLDLSTSGTHTTATALEHAAPEQPDQYPRLAHWLGECSSAIEKAANGIVEVDKFAENHEKLKPGMFGRFNIEVFEKNYTKASKYLQSFQIYQCQVELWNRTRVCQRCGEGFVTENDRRLSKTSIKVPDFIFEGIKRRCPTCHSFHWKTPEAYLSIKIRALEEVLKRDKSNLENAFDRANKPIDRDFKNLSDRTLLNSKYEDAKIKVEETQAKLTATIEERDHAISHHPDFKNIRICSDCEAIYTISDGSMCSLAQLDLNEKIDTRAFELAIDAEIARVDTEKVRAERLAALQKNLETRTDENNPESRNEQSVPTISQLSCVAGMNYLKLIKRTRKEWCLFFAWVVPVMFVFQAVIGHGIYSAWNIVLDPVWWETVVVATVAIEVLFWLLMRRWIAQATSWTETELYFSESNLRVCYPIAKEKPELSIPWSAIGFVENASHDKFGDGIVISIRNESIAGPIRTKLKHNFGSSFWMATPWVGAFSGAWWVRIFNNIKAIRILIDTTSPKDLPKLINDHCDKEYSERVLALYLSAKTVEEISKLAPRWLKNDIPSLSIEELAKTNIAQVIVALNSKGIHDL